MTQTETGTDAMLADHGRGLHWTRVCTGCPRCESDWAAHKAAMKARKASDTMTAQTGLSVTLTLEQVALVLTALDIYRAFGVYGEGREVHRAKCSAVSDSIGLEVAPQIPA